MLYLLLLMKSESQNKGTYMHRQRHTSMHAAWKFCADGQGKQGGFPRGCVTALKPRT